MLKKTFRLRKDIEYNVYSRQELAEFLIAVKNLVFEHIYFLKILSSLGLGKSEEPFLIWEDIDLNHSLLSVKRTLAIGLNNQTII